LHQETGEDGLVARLEVIRGDLFEHGRGVDAGVNSYNLFLTYVHDWFALLDVLSRYEPSVESTYM